MKFLIPIFLLSSVALVAQSKKDLIAKTQQLTTEVESLKAQINELKKDKLADLTDRHKKASYALGVLVAKNLKMQGGDSLDYEALTIGVGDVFEKDSLQLQPQDAAMFVQAYMQQAMEAKIAKAKVAGLAFLAENKTKAGVTETASGLQYKVISSGTGKKPTATDQVTVHYSGKLIDGTPFDSSIERGQPATFNVGEVVTGWIEALQLMREGDKWMIYLPSELGYGEQGSGQIPPNSVLVFEIELIKVN
jgi:FKBP-type peptidyl-prolyl cis-trans isomerase